MRRYLAAAVLAGAVLCWLPACGGGGGPTAPPPPPPPPPPPTGVSFTPAGIAGDNTIHLAQVDSGSQTVLRLEVRASMVDDLFGLGFDLDYPQGLLSWVKDATAEGDFLDGDGSDTELLIIERPGGNLIVGLTRLGDVGGVDGSGLLLTLEFTAIANGSDDLVFAENDAFDSAGTPIADTEWLAGEVSINLL